MKTLKLKIIFNGAQGGEQFASQAVERLRPKVSFDTYFLYTSYQNIPIADIHRADGKVVKGIDPEWYNREITSQAVDAHVVVFVLPVSQWVAIGCSPADWGFRTDRNEGPVEITIAADANEATTYPNGKSFNSLEDRLYHELAHSVSMIYGVPDTIHDWNSKSDPDGFVRELAIKDLPIPQELSRIGRALQYLAVWISRLLQPKKPAYFTEDSFLPTRPITLEEVPVEKNKLIKIWAEAIRIEEGGKPDNLNTRLKNPGNLKYSLLTKSFGATGKYPASDGGFFCIFPTQPIGMQALCSFLEMACLDKLKPYHDARTLRLFTRRYANPPNDGYANNIAKKLGVDIDIDISKLLA